MMSKNWSNRFVGGKRQIGRGAVLPVPRPSYVPARVCYQTVAAEVGGSGPATEPIGVYR